MIQTRGEQFRRKGKRGEKSAESFLIDFFDIYEPALDSGIDFIGTLRDSPVPQSVTFHIQVKTAEEFRARREDPPNQLDQWLDLLRRDSVMLFYVDDEALSSDQQSYRYLLLHQWCLANSDCSDKAKRRSVTFDLADFKKVTRPDFKAAIDREAVRVAEARRPTPDLPFDEIDIFRKVGRLDALEVPICVVREAVSSQSFGGDAHTAKHLRELAFQNTSSHGQPPSLIDQWARRANEPPPANAKAYQLRQLRHFLRFIKCTDSDEIPSIASFSDRGISVWGVLVQVFPAESLRMVERVVSRTNCSQEGMMAAASLLARLGTVGDQSFERHAQTLLDDMLTHLDADNTLRQYEQFRVIRQVLYESVAVGMISPKQFVDFLHRHPFEWEMRLHRRYYDSPCELPHFHRLFRKLNRPMKRDLLTKPISEYHIERLPKAVIRQAVETGGGIV